MSYLGTVTQQPSERLDYDLLYKKWFAEEDEIADFTVTISLGGVVLGVYVDGVPDRAPDVGDLVLAGGYNNSPRVKLFLEGGTDGKTYKVEVTARTRDGRVKQDEFRVKIKEI